MKKLIPFAFVTAILFMSCSGLLHRNNSDQIASVKVAIAKETYDSIIANKARTITPEYDTISYSNVSNWKITFTSDGYTKIMNTSELEDSIVLPYGEYSVSAEGSLTYGSSIYTYVGKIEELNVDSPELDVNINVGLKKSDGGTGIFIYFITFGDKFNITAAEQITAKMTNLKDDSIFYVKNDSIENPINDFTEIGFENKQYSIVKTDIPSGFYKLELYYQEKEGGSKAQIVLPDPYFVIADGLTTKVSDATTNIYKLIREYWATTDDSVTTNGITKDYPVYINTLLANLKTDTEWDEVNIYFDAGTNVSAVDFSLDDFSSKSLNVSYGNLKFIENSQYVTTYYVTSNGSYTVDGKTVQAAKNLSEVAALIDKVDYSDKDVNIIVSGHIKETAESHFYKIKNITISGQTDITEALSLDDFSGDDEMDDVIDFQNLDGVSGMNIENQNNTIEAITIKNLQICNGNGYSTYSTQWGGLRIDFGSNTTASSLQTINITNCRFYSNRGGSVGGSILLIGSGNGKNITAEINGCLLQNSSAKDPTSGILAVWSEVKSVLVNGCSFYANGSPDIILPKTTQTLASNITELTVKNTYFNGNSYYNDNNLNETASNISCQTGSLSLGAGNTTALNEVILICFQKGKAINVCEDISEDDVSYTLKPIDYENDGELNYNQLNAVITVADGVTLADIVGKFSMFDSTNYMLDDAGYIKDKN